MKSENTADIPLIEVIEDNRGMVDPQIQQNDDPDAEQPAADKNEEQNADITDSQFVHDKTTNNSDCIAEPPRTTANTLGDSKKPETGANNNNYEKGQHSSSTPERHMQSHTALTDCQIETLQTLNISVSAPANSTEPGVGLTHSGVEFLIHPYN